MGQAKETSPNVRKANSKGNDGESSQDAVTASMGRSGEFAGIGAVAAANMQKSSGDLP